jgi:hypothetical protein
MHKFICLNQKINKKSNKQWKAQIHMIKPKGNPKYIYILMADIYIVL